jgi:3-oxoacyl-[acyl-carrier protein] reductase
LALVTGASRGIGASIAQHLATDGCFVVGTATSAAGAAAISRTLGDTGAGIEMRVEDPQSIDAALADIRDRWGAPLVLINNAGVTRDNLLLRMSEEQWGQVIETNLSSIFRLCKPLLRGMMKARWGRIVNVGSVVARMGNPGQTNYVASKAGVEGFARALAAEVGSRGITVNTVSPGFIETDMTGQLSEDQRQQMLARVPLARMGQVSEVAQLVAFLASASAGYITGETIHINGGLYCA